MNHNDLGFSVNETWFGDWNPLRDEYGYPINTSMPAAFYVEHGSSVLKRWIPEQGQWNDFMDLTRMRPDTFHEAILRMPPELPFEALDHKTKKSIRTSRSRGLIKPSYPSLPHRTDSTGEVRRRRERNAILGPRILIAVLMVVTALIGIAVLLRLFVA